MTNSRNALESHMNSMMNLHPSFMHLCIYIDSDDIELIDRYTAAISCHNNKILNQNNRHIDAGFDLFTPEQIQCISGEINIIDLQVKCCAEIIDNASNLPINTGYYMYPRSSISNTPLRLACSVGIIDSGYRGKIVGKFDCLQSEYVVNKFDRLLQICAPGLVPIYVQLVNNEGSLGTTERGAGGFGSSGR